MSETYGAPNWDNSSVFPSLESIELKDEIIRTEENLRQLAKLTEKFTPHLRTAKDMNLAQAKPFLIAAWEVAELREKTFRSVWDLEVYSMVHQTVDSKNQAASELKTRAQRLWSRLDQVVQPVEIFLTSIPENGFKEYARSPKAKSECFWMAQLRKRRDVLLSVEEETLIHSLEVDGLHAWGNLYQSLTGEVRCKVDLGSGKIEEMGVAEAIGHINSPEDKVRESAYRAIKDGYRVYEESCASILNAMASWRLSIDARRSRQWPVHFLDEALHESRISRETLGSMMGVVQNSVETFKKAMKLRARVLGKKQLDPWDGGAPLPKKYTAGASTYSWDEGVKMVRDAFAAIHPDMAGVVDMMVENKWIDAAVGPRKQSGAYATRFAKKSEPRIFLTYMGSISHIFTLAHELGHAFHNWVMRDMNLMEVQYPMTLAETASIFAETVLQERLFAQAKSDHEKLQASWYELGSAIAFTLNIPTRLLFEKRFYEKVGQQKYTPQAFRQEMEGAWRDIYGDSLSEVDEMFWASKLHFHRSDTRFYNFPYTFGYLFALGVYARKDKLGDDFYQSYVSLLRDCGRMTAEDLAQKYLKVDIRKPEFWKESVGIIERKVDAFEKLCDRVLV